MALELFDLENGYGVFSRSNYQSKKHSHYAIQIVCSISGLFHVETQHGHLVNLQNAVIPPNTIHSFDCLNASCNLLYIDPLSPIGRYFMVKFELVSHKNILVNISESKLFHKNGEFDILGILEVSKWVNKLTIDPRITNCMREIDYLTAEDKVDKITVSQLSEIAFLSESRLAHLFKNELGISVHQYILWKKISLAMLKSRQGLSLTYCAHYVGFADSSHFNRAFYKMFGIKPFFVLKR